MCGENLFQLTGSEMKRIVGAGSAFSDDDDDSAVDVIRHLLFDRQPQPQVGKMRRREFLKKGNCQQRPSL